MSLDKQGRLLGRVNLLDLMALFFLLSLASTVWYGICVSQYRSLQTFSIEPKRITAGSGKYLIIKGTGFDQSTTIRLGNYPDRESVYFDESTIRLEILADTQPGLYQVIVRDGHGRYAVLPDAVEVVWVPNISGVNQKVIYNTGKEETRINILGAFFARPCSVRIGDRELDHVEVVGSEHIAAELDWGDPLPLGEQPVTVTNAGGQSVTLEHGVTVLPLPEVTAVEPNLITVGNAADLIIHGKRFTQPTTVWLSSQVLGEATYVSPECLRIRVTPGSSMVGEMDLAFQLSDGPKITVLRRALKVRGSVLTLAVVAILLDEKSPDVLQMLKESPEWELKRPLRQTELRWANRNFNLDRSIVEVVLPVAMVSDARVRKYSYRGRPLHTGDAIDFSVNDRKFSGVVAAEPFAVFTDDLLRKN